jgi:predicted ferric reductase
MILNKIKEYLSIGLIVLIIGIFFYVKTMISNYEKIITELKTEKVKVLKTEKNQIRIKRDSVIKLKLYKYDSLLKVKQEIKYIRYEKPIYINRSLDKSLDILSNYTYKKTTINN